MIYDIIGGIIVATVITIVMVATIIWETLHLMFKAARRGRQVFLKWKR